MSYENKKSRYRNLFQSRDSQLIWQPDQSLPYVMYFKNGQTPSPFFRSKAKKKLIIWPEVIRTESANTEQYEDQLWFSRDKERCLKGRLLSSDSSNAVFEIKQGDTTQFARISVMNEKEFLSIQNHYKNRGRIPPTSMEHLVQLKAWDEWVADQRRLLPRKVYYVETDNITAGFVGIDVIIEAFFDKSGKNRKWVVSWWDPTHQRQMLANEIKYDKGVFTFTRDPSELGGHFRFSVMELDIYNEIVRKTLFSAPYFSDVDEMNKAFFEAAYD